MGETVGRGAGFETINKVQEGWVFDSIGDEGDPEYFEVIQYEVARSDFLDEGCVERVKLELEGCLINVDPELTRSFGVENEFCECVVVWRYRVRRNVEKGMQLGQPLDSFARPCATECVQKARITSSSTCEA